MRWQWEFLTQSPEMGQYTIQAKMGTREAAVVIRFKDDYINNRNSETLISLVSSNHKISNNSIGILWGMARREMSRICREKMEKYHNARTSSEN